MKDNKESRYEEIDTFDKVSLLLILFIILVVFAGLMFVYARQFIDVSEALKQIERI